MFGGRTLGTVCFGEEDLLYSVVLFVNLKYPIYILHIIKIVVSGKIILE